MALKAAAARAELQGALIGQATLMSLAFAGVDLAPIGRQLRARAESGDANAWMDLSCLLQLVGQAALGLAAQGQALSLNSLYHLPAPAGTAGIKLLALMAPGDLMTNAPLDFLLEDSDIALDMLYVGADLPFPPSLPDHDVMFVAVGESAGTHELLRALEPVVADWPRPVLNRPQMIAASARDRVCRTLAAVPGLLLPDTLRLGRAALVANAADLAFPLIVRPLDSHAGKGLAKLEAMADLGDYLVATAAEDFFVSPFVDYRGVGGRFRKYRVVLIDARPYAVHMAISAHWMVHYLNADMNGDAAKRAEEADFMENFDSGFARRHAQALAAIAERLGLDYLVVDCAEMGDGRLLVFEVDTGAVVHLMDPPDLFPYKPPQMRKVFAAFRQMLAVRVP